MSSLVYSTDFIMEENNVIENKENVIDDNGPYKVFAIIGYALGLLNIVLMLAPVVGVHTAIAGIIMSVLGKKSTRNGRYANIGLVFNIIETIITSIWTIAFISLYILSLRGRI